ncbi:hypothetical protein HU200_042241 [Digitaria exilis]|uniref:Protein kinase domain-containing protein n=1 Tax=Digitaria exilis TaxID=1010633 RepID=A0A835B5H1_9POAL|nr:hypothetical protein HU200_042241 [Digitaria exilis]CAB3453274.1 unnamed protein product [Digitaria exilis]
MAKVLTVPTAALLLLLACCFAGVHCDDTPEVRRSLIAFLRELAGGDDQVARDLGWGVLVPPCGGGGVAGWKNVSCRPANDGRVRAVTLESNGARLNGTINATLLCAETAIRTLSLHGNALRGGIPADIWACKALTHLYVSGNQLSGSLPPSLAQLSQLQVLDVSGNDFSGEIPGDLSKLPGLVRFFANDNRLNGTIPDFNLDQLKSFTVSNNNLTGPVPKNAEKFGNQSFWPNAAGICGAPLFESCPPPPSKSPQQTGPLSPPPPSSGSGSGSGSGAEADDGHGNGKHKKRAVPKIVMYLGYVLLGVVILAFVLYKICSNKKKRSNKLGLKSKPSRGKGVYGSSRLTTTTTTTTSVTTPNKSAAYSIPTSAEHSVAATGAASAVAPPSTSLVVLRRSGTASPITSRAAAAAAKDLRFEDLLKSPAELLGRGRFGSSYKVVVPGGAALAVKRVKDAAVDEAAFRRRMERIGRAKHAAVLPPLAFYCAMQEKLVVYEFQSNGSLEKLLHGSIESSQGPLDWAARLHIAAKVADGMAFMHTTLSGSDGATSNNSPSSGDDAAATDGPIAHGNLKASNVLFTAGMDPCVSEYGVTSPAGGDAAALRGDVHAFGVLLLELLTGKATSARGDGAELARWVTSVIREEWTAEVFDRALLAGGGGDGSSEQRMVRLLQVAMRCVDASPGSPPPPTMREVAGMVNAIREEDDRSFSLEA